MVAASVLERAALAGRPVFVSAIAARSADLATARRTKAVALPHGLQDLDERIVGHRRVDKMAVDREPGDCAMYHREPREPTVRDLALGGSR